MKVMWFLKRWGLGMLLLFLVLAGRAVGQNFKGFTPSGTRSKGLKGTSPSAPIIQKGKIVPNESRRVNSDLSIERIYVKGCQVYITVANRGKAGLSLRDYNNGRLSLTLQWQTGTSAGLEPRVFTLKQVDPKGALGRPGGWVEFNTRVWVKYRSFTVRAKLERLKDDRGKGRKDLRRVLAAPEGCLKIVSGLLKRNINKKALSLKKTGSFEKKKFHPAVLNKEKRELRPLNSPPSYVQIVGNKLIFDKPITIKWNPEAIKTCEGSQIISCFPADTVKISLIRSAEAGARTQIEAAILSSTPNDGIETIRITHEISFPVAPAGTMTQNLIIGDSYCVKVSSSTAAYSGAKILEPWIEVLKPREGESLVPQNYKIVIKKHPPEQYLEYQIWAVVDVAGLRLRKLLYSSPYSSGSSHAERHLTPSYGEEGKDEFLWDGHLSEEILVLPTGENLGEWWEDYEGPFTLEIEAWFRSRDGADHFLERIKRRVTKVKALHAFPAGEGWTTVSHSDLAIENIRVHGRDIDIMVVNHGPEPFRGTVIPLEVTVSDRFSSRTYQKEYHPRVSIPVNGVMSISLGGDLGICLQDTSFTVGAKLKPQGYWTDDNPSNDSRGKHFDLTIDPRPNLYFAGRRALRITRRGDEVKVRSIIGYDGPEWCLKAHTVRLRLTKPGGEIIYRRDIQTERGPVEFTLSASEVRRLGGREHVAVEVFLDWWDVIKEKAENDNWRYVYYDF